MIDTGSRVLVKGELFGFVLRVNRETNRVIVNFGHAIDEYSLDDVEEVA